MSPLNIISGAAASLPFMEIARITVIAREKIRLRLICPRFRIFPSRPLYQPDIPPVHLETKFNLFFHPQCTSPHFTVLPESMMITSPFTKSAASEARYTAAPT